MEPPIKKGANPGTALSVVGDCKAKFEKFPNNSPLPADGAMLHIPPADWRVGCWLPAAWLVDGAAGGMSGEDNGNGGGVTVPTLVVWNERLGGV